MLGLDSVGMATGYEIRPAVTSPEDLEALVSQLSRLSESVQEIDDAEPEEEDAPIIELRESADEAPVVKLVHSLIADAVQRGASDIHFDPRDGDMRVRFRIDGVVVSSTTVPRRLVAGLVSRIKIMADLDIAERRVPQDGRCGLSVDDREIDIRIATLPVIRGESVVMRILDKGRLAITLDELGMLERDRELLESAISRVHGAVLVTGPDRGREDDDALRGAHRGQHARADADRDRGPGRVRARRGQADPGQPEDGAVVRRRAALDDPLGSRRADGRRDPRQ